MLSAEIYSPCSTNIEETKLDIEEDLLSPHNSVTKSCEDQDQDISSHGRLSHDSILTSGEAAHLESVSKYEFEVFEAETPGRSVSSVFICLYSVLGKILKIGKLGSYSSLLKSLNSTFKVSIQKQKEQSWR